MIADNSLTAPKEEKSVYSIWKLTYLFVSYVYDFEASFEDSFVFKQEDYLCIKNGV